MKEHLTGDSFQNSRFLLSTSQIAKNDIISLNEIFLKVQENYQG